MRLPSASVAERSCRSYMVSSRSCRVFLTKPRQRSPKVAQTLWRVMSRRPTRRPCSGFGLSFFGPKDACKKLESVKVVRTVAEEPCSLEIISIHQPDERTVQMTRVFGVTTEVRDAISAGVIRCKHVCIRDELCRGDAEPELPDRIEVLVIQSFIVDFLRPGFIIRVTLGELNIGLKYMANLPEILPSFYRFLPQSLMRKYKVPAPNPRPAPSALGPMVEDVWDVEE